MPQTKIITKSAAEAAKFKPLTDGYSLPAEAKMMANVLADMARSAIPTALVLDAEGRYEVWRQ